MNRTTSALEGNHSVLSRNIPKRSTLLRFISGLLPFERKKSYEVDLLIESGGASGLAKKSSSKVSWKFNLSYFQWTGLEKSRLLNKLIHKQSVIRMFCM